MRLHDDICWSMSDDILWDTAPRNYRRSSAVAFIIAQSWYTVYPTHHISTVIVHSSRIRLIISLTVPYCDSLYTSYIMCTVVARRRGRRSAAALSCNSARRALAFSTAGLRLVADEQVPRTGAAGGMADDEPHQRFLQPPAQQPSQSSTAAES